MLKDPIEDGGMPIDKQPAKTISDNTLSHLAFDNSAQANIITTVSTKQIVMVNSAACKLLGYDKAVLLAKKLPAIFDMNANGFKKMLRQRKAKGYATGFVTLIKYDGTPVPCEITSSVFKNTNGVEKSITSIMDLRAGIERQMHIDIKKEKIVAKNIDTALAKQKGIDTKKDKLVANNIVIAGLKQKNIDKTNRRIVENNICLALAKQKGIDSKNKKTVAHNITLAKKKQKNIDLENKKIVNNNIVVALAKASEEVLTERSANKAAYREEFSAIFNSSSDVFFDADLVNGEVIVSDAYEKEFGYKLSGNMLDGDNWTRHIHHDDKEAVLRDYARMLASTDTEWKHEYRFLKATGEVANVLSTRVIMRDSDGNAYRMIGSMHDVSKQKVLEERLEEEIMLKEKQVAQATEDAKEIERSNIGKELHDNINQLLGASKMYLEMAKKGGENSKMYLARSSEYTLTAIEEIRKLTKGLTTDIIKNIGLCVAIENLAKDMTEVNHVKISCLLKNFNERMAGNKFKLNIFRIVQEHLNNILKHAQATYIAIRLLQNEEFVVLGISDNGVGFDTNKKQNGSGVANIKSRANAYEGIADFVSKPGQGCVLTVTFPINAET